MQLAPVTFCEVTVGTCNCQYSKVTGANGAAAGGAITDLPKQIKNCLANIGTAPYANTGWDHTGATVDANLDSDELTALVRSPLTRRCFPSCVLALSATA